MVITGTADVTCPWGIKTLALGTGAWESGKDAARLRDACGT